MLNKWMYTISIHRYPDMLVWRRAVKLIHQSIKEGSIPWYFSMSVKKTSTPRGRPLSLSPHEGRSPWLLKVPVCQKLLLTFQFGLDFSVRPPQPPTLLHTPRERKEIYIWISQTKHGKTFACAALWAVHSSAAISDCQCQEYRCLCITMLCEVCCAIPSLLSVTKLYIFHICLYVEKQQKHCKNLCQKDQISEAKRKKRNPPVH